MKNLLYLNKRAFIFLLFVVFFFESNAVAQQLTQGITYQGKLVENGLPVSGNQTIFFELIDNTGNITWSETQTVTVQDGLYSVVLGSQTPLPSSVFSATPNLNLRVTINGNVLSPNVPLRATPYAHTAGSVIRNSIGTLQIIDGSILPTDIRSGGNDKLLGTTVSGEVVWLDRATTVSASGVAGGDLTGSYPNPQIAVDSVDSDNILDGTITNIDINANAAILGTKIDPDFGNQDISTTGDIEGDELNINGEANIIGEVNIEDDVFVDADLEMTGDIIIGGRATSAQTVVGDAGNTLTTKDYVDGQITGAAALVDNVTIEYNGISELIVKDGGISNAKLQPNSVSNTNLQNNSVTINTGAGLNGGNTVALGGTINLTATDASITNELQDLTLAGNTLSITNDPTPTNTIDLTPYLNTDNQNLNLTATTVGTRDITITGGNTLALNVEDGDFDNTNELQDLQLLIDTLTITGNPSATSIDLTPYRQNLLMSGNQIQISGGGSANLSFNPPMVDGEVLTWSQTNNRWEAITPATFTNTDNQTLSLTGTTPTTRQITISGGNFLNLNINDADFDITNEIQDIAITGNSIGITGGTGFNLTPNAPANGQVLTWNNLATRWEAQNTPSSPFTISGLNIFRNVANEKFIYGSDQMNHTAAGANRMFYDKATGAFRTGGTTGTAWDTRGAFSFAAGENNIAIGTGNTVSGGNNNQALNNQSTVGGGGSNVAGGFRSTVGGGFQNTANGVNSTVAGGRDNIIGGAAGSANIAGGLENNISGGNRNAIGGGFRNAIFTGLYNTIAGGNTNESTNSYTTIGGGSLNKANGEYSTLAGGESNEVNGLYGTIGGGFANVAEGISSTIAGGTDNQAFGEQSSILGGTGLFARSYGEVVLGFFNTDYTPTSATSVQLDDRLLVIGNGLSDASRSNAMVLYKDATLELKDFGLTSPSNPTGRLYVEAGQLHFDGSPVGGTTYTAGTGISISAGVISSDDFDPGNEIQQISFNAGTNILTLDNGGGTADLSSLAGGGSPFTVSTPNVFRNVANEKFIFGSNQMNFSAGTDNRMFFDDATGAFRVGGTTGVLWDTRGAFSFAAGQNTSATGSHSTVSGGVGNLANFDFATVGGGLGNQANNLYATVAGGQNARADGQFSSIGGGDDNQAIGGYSTVTGGNTNIASGLNSTVTGGNTNTASGDYSVVSGGRVNLATGLYSTVAGGEQSSAEGDYSFTFGIDNTNQGDFSTAIGSKLVIDPLAIGTFAVGDRGIGFTGTTLTASDHFYGRFAGGYTFGTSTNGLGNIDDGVYITGGANPRMGIGINAPTESLHVIGNILASGTVTPSDIRYKKNILTLNNSISNIQKLRGTSYDWKDKKRGTKLQFGVIAQEIEEVFPNLVHTDNEGYKSVNYTGLIPVLIEATKEQQTIIEAQEEKISKLETQVKELKELVLLLKDENDSNSTLSKKVDALEKQLISLVNQLSELTAQK
ncbi:tail fiber domain-containing protein [Bernardetia sp. OM2101]|uniref:tail fiber domain-containing protein n=1 Tax=Bernardetia sp. OM2101 TaxID=3344876 RepID=UPI0035CE9E87